MFSEYESFVRSAPWTRHPATEILRQICMTFTVREFHPPHFLELNHLHLGESIYRSP